MDAFERNIIGHTNNIAVEITKEFLNNGLEIRYSAKEATIENLNIKRSATVIYTIGTELELVKAYELEMGVCEFEITIPGYMCKYKTHKVRHPGCLPQVANVTEV